MNLNTLVWALEELADKELQEQLWMGKIPGKMGLFDEAVCQAFNDSNLDLLLDRGDKLGELSPAALKKADQFRRLVAKVPAQLPELELIHSPQMEAVRIAAAELLTLLRPVSPLGKEDGVE